MKTVLKFFACIVFASAALSLQGFTVENRTLHEIEVYAFYERSFANTTESMFRQEIPFQNAVVSWISKHWDEEISLINNPCCVTLQPGQKVDVTIGQDRKTYHLSVGFWREEYLHSGARTWYVECAYHVSADDIFIFGQETKLSQKFNTNYDEPELL